MAELTREEFNRLKEESSNRIREMYKGHSMPPYPDFVKLEKPAPPPSCNPIVKPVVTQKPCSSNGQNPLAGILRSVNLSELLKNPESLLILGLIILLMSDHADEKLILALVFIML